MNIELTEKEVLIIMIALDKYRNTIPRLENLDEIIDDIKISLLESI